MQDMQKTDGAPFDPKHLIPFLIGMAAVVVASNVLVQYPVRYDLGPLILEDLLTWGAFTYPIAFLVTDLCNRTFGPAKARIVVIAGFAIAVGISIYAATPRIAIASGTAFLVAQLLDVSIFHRLRDSHWWRAPLISSVLGSVLDTLLFFSLAFAASFALLGANDDFAIEAAPFLGAFGFDAPRWMSWSVGDLAVKLLVALSLLAPYRIIIPFFQPLRPAA